MYLFNFNTNKDEKIREKAKPKLLFELLELIDNTDFTYITNNMLLKSKTGKLYDFIQYNIPENMNKLIRNNYDCNGAIYSKEEKEQIDEIYYIVTKFNFDNYDDEYYDDLLEDKQRVLLMELKKFQDNERSKRINSLNKTNC